MKTLKLKDRTISTEKPAFVMGIVNATPDSFWHESRGGIENAMKLIEQGADLLDIGGESTRPGSSYVDAAEEISRVVPLVKEIRRNSDIPVSIDTRKLEVMQAAYDCGADILNDVSALEDDERLASFAAKTEIPVILMHKRGNPDIMQNNASYSDAFAEVDAYLNSRVEFALKSGIRKDRIILDANIALIKNCGRLCQGDFPVLMALSRQSCIGQITGKDVENRLAGTLAADIIAVLAGAFMIRVHDVKEAVDSMNVLKALGSEI